jgi:hypothetical protein
VTVSSRCGGLRATLAVRTQKKEAALAEIRVESPVPESHSQRRAIEAVVRGTLRDFARTWQVLIRPAQTAPWWVVMLDREGGDFRRTLLVDPSLTPEAVEKALLEALRGAA